MFGLYEKNHPSEEVSCLHEDGMPLKRDVFYSYNTTKGQNFDTLKIICMRKSIYTNFLYQA